ncbi:MAG: S-layer homology domain-containing protein [Clostridia bacterium]|nr:S-layer homology domain-containing protein [Clostridia bacterium]
MKCIRIIILLIMLFVPASVNAAVDAKDHWAEEYIIEIEKEGIMSGNGILFMPDKEITRAEFVVATIRAIGDEVKSVDNSFPDVDKNSFYAPFIAQAAEQGIISGYEDGTFRPDKSLTREEAMIVLSRSFGFLPGYSIGDEFSDSQDIAGVARNAFAYALKYGVINGYPDKTLRPKATLTRAEAAVLILGARKIENVTPIPYKSGDGTRENPYGIYTAAQLDAIRYYRDKAFVLKNDIKLSGEWAPIEDFYGNLDGAGYKIDGLLVNTDDSYAGLFKRITKGEVKNLTVDGQVSARGNAGIIAGEFLDGKISNCTVSGKVMAVTNNAGGFFGESAGRIENCLSGVYIVESGSFAGGITGQNYGIIKNSLSAAHTVVADIYAGGISSVNVGGRIENSVSACIRVYDMFLGNCGRITTNKKNSYLSNNYAYSGMVTTSELDVNQGDNNNGADVSWEELINRDTLCKILGWSKQQWIGGGREEAYLIPRPLSTKAPEFLSGITEYAPVKVRTSAELLGMIDNPDMHYLLADNIYFGGNVKWRVAADSLIDEQGFTGTFDGAGKTIYNLSVESGETGRCGLFGVIYSGTVRNLNLANPNYLNGKIVGAIAAVNHGTIENCSINGFQMNVSGDSSYVGGVVGYNYGTLRAADASGNIESVAKNIVAGGICGHNEGFIDDVAYSGSIRTSKIGGVSESVASGICGYNAGGMIYNAYSSADIRQQATTIYSGGICAIQSDGEIYKCSSRGITIAEQPGVAIAVAYSGGITGLAAGGIVMNTYSACDIKQYTLKSYLGGICGYNEAAIIQNAYATGSLLQTNDAEIKKDMISYAGGICGYNEYGTVLSTVAVNPSISSYGVVARICPGGMGEQINGNYAVPMDIATEGEGNFGGTTVAQNRLSTSFFTKPLFEGGLMGWSEEIWVSANNYAYTLPVLSGVRNQGVFRY